MLHGPQNYFIKKEKKAERISGDLFPFKALQKAMARLKNRKPVIGWGKGGYRAPEETETDNEPAQDVIKQPPHNAPPRRIFCRLFGKGAQANPAALIDLGLAMETESVANVTVSGDSNIPAGYTYLGQFIDHDMTATNGPALSADGVVDIDELINERSPRLDLDSLYGKGPRDPDSAAMYEDDGVHLKVGQTTATPDGAPGGPIPGDGPHDLPRNSDSSAIIGDGRNDENLAVAQTHLAFIQFHNRKVDELNACRGLSGKELFNAARKETVLHYQSIVLTDFLPKIIEQGVLQDVIKNGRKFYTQDDKGCMPLEFAVAAYRLGHSMVRPDYEWNRIFNSNPGGIRATFELLFEFSGVSGTRTPDQAADPPFFGNPTLPSNWPVDWTRMYDFSSVAGIDTHPDLNFARKIDASLALALKTLPEFQRDPTLAGLPDEEKTILFSLATRNLLRGRLLELPTGQQVADKMIKAGVEFTPITAEEIASSPHREIVEANNFHYDTPLWYYILREAKVRHDGNFLGPVGSRIVAEVFVGLIDDSRINVFRQRPGLTFSMPELLAEVGDINPLGS